MKYKLHQENWSSQCRIHIKNWDAISSDIIEQAISILDILGKDLYLKLCAMGASKSQALVQSIEHAIEQIEPPLYLEKQNKHALFFILNMNKEIVDPSYIHLSNTRLNTLLDNYKAIVLNKIDCKRLYEEYYGVVDFLYLSEIFYGKREMEPQTLSV